MESAFTNPEMKATLIQITNERDQLKLELMHANSAIVELEKQIIEFEGLLSKALSQLEIRSISQNRQ